MRCQPDALRYLQRINIEVHRHAADRDHRHHDPSVLGLFVFFRYTRGLAMRATALDQEAALATGINSRCLRAACIAAIATAGSCRRL
jgi:hypothetical protein